MHSTNAPTLTLFSPELLSKPEYDYAVYAYDVAEYDTPLAGHGLLSSFFVDSQAETEAFAHGLICESASSPFSEIAKEVLEVRLKLVPVLQRTNNHWQDRWENNGKEDIPSSPLSCSNTTSRPPSRATSAAQGFLQRQPSMSAYQQRLNETEDEEPGRKRARLTRASWQGKSTFGAPSESLRVTASAAASVRNVHKSATRQDSLEGLRMSERPPRAPTPRPQEVNRRPNLQRAAAASSMPRRGSYNGTSPSYQSPYASMSTKNEGLEPSMLSPDDDDEVCGAAETPSDMPSSPPGIQTTSPTPSSPALPCLSVPAAPHPDSGFMSESADRGLVRCDSDATQRSEHDRIRSRRLCSPPKDIKFKGFFEEIPGPPDLLPKHMLPIPRPTRRATTTGPSGYSSPRRVGGSVRTFSSMPESGLVAPLHPVHTEQTVPKPVTGTSSSRCPNTGEEIVGTVASPVSQQPDITRKSSSSFLTNEGALKRNDSSVAENLQSRYDRSGDGTSREREPFMQSDSNGAYFPAEAPVDTGNEAAGDRTKGSGSSQDDLITNPATSNEGPRESCKLRSGSGAKRKRAIENELAKALNQGRPPQYCRNCGEIKTPTWRKAWTKLQHGPPPDWAFDLKNMSKQAGCVTAWEPIEKDADDRITMHRIYKKAVERGVDVDYEEISLCNRKC